MADRTTAPNTFIVSNTFFPMGHGALTASGAQYSASVACDDTTDYTVVETAHINPGLTGVVYEVSFSLTAGIRADDTTDIIAFKWQARDFDDTGSWTDLVSATWNCDDTSVYTDKTYSGVFNCEDTSVTTFIGVPFDLRYTQKVNGGGDKSDAYCKSSSWVKIKWRQPIT